MQPLLPTLQLTSIQGRQLYCVHIVYLITDPMIRLAIQRRIEFITDIWHPTQFLRITRQPLKYKTN